jgi:Zn-dependent protease with chaperone function
MKMKKEMIQHENEFFHVKKKDITTISIITWVIVVIFCLNYLINQLTLFRDLYFKEGLAFSLIIMSLAIGFISILFVVTEEFKLRIKF